MGAQLSRPQVNAIWRAGIITVIGWGVTGAFFRTPVAFASVLFGGLALMVIEVGLVTFGLN